MNTTLGAGERQENLKYLRTTITWLWSAIVRLVCGLGIILSFYLLTALVGLIPTNNGFVPANAESTECVKIYVRSNGVHADIIVPTRTDVIDWREYFPLSDFRPNTALKKHVAIGWGDRGFYLNTPTWDDLTVSTTANAILLPSESVMHVSFTSPTEDESCKSTTISVEQYRRLVDFTLSSFRMQAGSQSNTQTPPKPKAIDAKYSYSWNDRFYEATGYYHGFRTCNCWVGRGLRHCGIRVAWFTPLPRSVFAHWPGERRGWTWWLLLLISPALWIVARIARRKRQGLES